MAPLSVTFSDFEGHFCCLKFFYLTYLDEIQRVLSTICLKVNWKVRMSCNFNCFLQEGLLKVSGSNVHCKCDNISQTVPDRVVVVVTTIH